MNKTMKAIVVHGVGGPEVMHYEDSPLPTYGATDLLVRVRACAVNRIDLIQYQGSYKLPPTNSEILGIEIAGEVVACGSDVTNFNVSDRVFGYVNGGGYAQYCAADAKLLNPLPNNWNFEQGAAVAEAFQVAYELLFTECNLRSGQTLLIYGGASSLGIAMIQLAKKRGARVIVTVSTEAKIQFCLTLGADFCINYKEQDILTEIKRITNNQGVNLIIDPVGPTNLALNTDCLDYDSTIMMIGNMGGDSAVFYVLPFEAKRATLKSYNTRGRTLDYQREIVKRFQEQCLPSLAHGTFSMPIDRCFDLTEVADAHRYMAANKNIGKIILRVS